MRLTPEHRLRKSSEIQALTGHGRRSKSRFFTLVQAPSPTHRLRLGLAVSRKVGNAVHRNRLRRRVREIVRNLCRGDEAWDLLIIARPGAGELAFQDLSVEIGGLLQRGLRGSRSP